jgi:hypothetical protein
MRAMRVFLPSTLPDLARTLEAGEIGPAPLTAYTVTPVLREWYASGDQEELEYTAMVEAARVSLRLLSLDPQAPSRRVVLAVEAPEALLTRDPGDGLDAGPGERATVRVTAPLPTSKIVAGHIDDAEAETDVRAARLALPAADAGDEDAQFVVDGAEGHELMWYATQELEYLLH